MPKYLRFYKKHNLEYRRKDYLKIKFKTRSSLFEIILLRSCISLFEENQKWIKDYDFKSRSFCKIVWEKKSWEYFIICQLYNISYWKIINISKWGKRLQLTFNAKQSQKLFFSHRFNSSILKKLKPLDDIIEIWFCFLLIIS